MRFVKMQGCGNDYIIVDGSLEKVAPEKRGQLAERLSDRHYGIGSDGLIFIYPGDTADFRMEMYNADGSPGEMCGNGVRCVGRYLTDKGLVNPGRFTVESAGRVVTLEKVKTSGCFRVDMGRPQFVGEELPVEGYLLQRVSMGNPHAVLFVKRVEQYPVAKVGPFLECASCFPDRTNVEFVEVEDRSHISMRVWERGSGETLACGTGACAAGVVCIQKGLTDGEITVKLLGGKLKLTWDGGEDSVYLTGPAETVYEGTV